MNAIPTKFRMRDLGLPCLVATLGLAGSLGMGLRPQPGTMRVAVLTVPGTSAGWSEVSQSGLPVVRVALGGWLIVVDGTGEPENLAKLRAAPLVLLDAAKVPGCSVPDLKLMEKKANDSDA